jgi:H+/gluconate symporter-like permease
MEVVGIILSLFLLIFFAYRGYSVILFAPVFAVLAAFTQGFSPMPTYTELFMGKAVVFIKAFFPVFMLGAVFGKVMEETGLAKSVARVIIQKLGKDRAILSVILAGMVLTYGGVSLFVCVFAVYPFAAEVFKEAEIPKRLLPATIAVGAFSVTMDALPGTPQIQNIIPTNYFGTNVYAAPIVGTIGGILTVACALFWLEHRRKKAKAAGEGYGEGHHNEPEVDPNMKLVDWKLAILPLLSVLVVNYLMTTFFPWSPDMLEPFRGMKLPLIAAAVKNVASIWSLITALLVGIALCVALGKRNFKTGGLAKALNAGAIGSLLAIMNTGSEVGYGNVIASLPGFAAISDALLSVHIGSTPLFSEAITVTTLAGVTGSASGGMSIALELMGAQWLEWANAIGVTPEILHRVASMASGGMDTLPHNGAVITLLAVCGLTHKQSYKDIFVVTMLKTSMAFVVIILYLITGVA